MDRRRSQTGFSLVELSIVLAIVGLLVGGIMAGIGLLKSAKLRAVMQDTHAYIVATQQFQKQYGYLPGDFPHAVKIWGKADGDADLTTNSGNCLTPGTDVAAPNATCNGDGNGVIDAGVYYEFWRAWQQLSLAKLIAGSYTGIRAISSGLNEPTSKFEKSAFAFHNTRLTAVDDAACIAGVCSSASSAYDGDYTNALHFGLFAVNDLNPPPGIHRSGSGAILSGKDAYELDSKFDDGYPAIGNIRTWKSTVLANCASGTSSDATSTYQKARTDAVCSLIFMNAYRSNKAGAE